ncbi:UDP-glucose 4-epimerase family protein [Stutzerimonas stutzeri]|jgi:nucleoside-diphosphate-sugar epimerase|uniref:UDP-glucose 4-epimerase family protein n=1 Tax=Stutzerimonas stutzeri TaxID=316 RepID=UPI002109FFB2|nr:SDR family oxidoreductase [Stutzerimonas stutzeri]MCQ4239542.1 SDR family oxidoreductase [Stutzerimonas stutzeri]
MNVLVTGATGFVGSALVRRLGTEGEHSVVGAVRSLGQRTSHVTTIAAAPVRWLELGDLARAERLDGLFEGIDVVVHCAARVHMMSDGHANPSAAFRAVNVDGTIKLAKQSALEGVRRFVFLSSVKVNGERTWGVPFRADDMPAPEDAYALSKLEAEQGLMEVAASTGMDVVIIRAPLVYGPGVKGNFESLIKLVDKQLPLPFGAIHNKRSLVSIANLVDLVIRCMTHDAAANQIFLAGDGKDVSTTELLHSIAGTMGTRVWLIPVPAEIIRLSASLIGKRAVAQRLLDSLQLDISKTRELLGWLPRQSFEEGLYRCLCGYGQGGNQ